MSEIDDFSGRKRRLEVGDATIAYLDEGDGAPVLLLHGCPFSTFVWRKVVPEAMSQENVELVRRINELFNRGDFERMYALADPSPEFEYVPNVEAGPDIVGVQRGREGFRRVVEVFWDEFDDPHIELHELIDGGEQVFIAASFRGRGSRAGRDELGTALGRMDRTGRQGESLAGIQEPGRSPRGRGGPGVGDVAGERGGCSEHAGDVARVRGHRGASY